MATDRSDARVELGKRGEEAAAAYLERLGYQIVDRNWRTKVGEIDIVALDGETLVLCEVKTRRSRRTGTPEDAVSATKQRRIARLAEAYLTSAGISGCPVRFDVIGLLVLAEDRALLRHHRAAFVLGD
ncbi:MAG: YraN family protein [Anaerosomatales bacterium]|nr:YraN family protein [Anaerosomatales bacterium]